jgi:hypothetical protein
MEKIVPNKTRCSDGKITFLVTGIVTDKIDTYTVLQSITGSFFKPKPTEMTGDQIREIIEKDRGRRTDGLERGHRTNFGGSSRLTTGESVRAKQRRQGGTKIRKFNYRELLPQIQAKIAARG